MTIIHLASDVFIDENILPLIIEDHMYLLSTRPTNVRSKHDVIKGFSLHSSLVKNAGGIAAGDGGGRGREGEKIFHRPPTNYTTK